MDSEETIYVGIDPSMNSTGIAIQYYADGTLENEQFYIIKSTKLTKKEKLANDQLLKFDYLIFEKDDLKKYEDNHEHEYYKTLNMIDVIDQIKDILRNIKLSYPNADIHVVQEGISYGSTLRTKSVFDLAGLNYMIRLALIKYGVENFTIAPPSEIKKFASGNGNCKKEVMISLFNAVHPELNIIPKIDDIADAYFMANYAKYLNEKDV